MNAYPLLETIDDPAQLRRLERKQLPQLATELRAFIVDSVAATGGHLSSNLGTVELTIALHYVFRTPVDKLIWDVGHQTYGHKILTGGADEPAAAKGGLAGLSRPRGKCPAIIFGTAQPVDFWISAGIGGSRAP
jgi:1-deoxy-D-xylulose-5-phosphate synthase